MYNNIKPSLCCISLMLKKYNNLSFKSITRKKYLKIKSTNYISSFKILEDTYLHNLNVSFECLKLCFSKNWNYRFSSDIFPLYTLPSENFNIFNFPNSSILLNKLKEIGNYIKNNNIRISTHPGQFTVICSENPLVVENSIRDLEYHGLIFDLMGLEQSYNYPINIHLNLRKGDPQIISDRFCSVFNNKLSSSVKKRLVCENEDKPNSWKVHELYANLYNKIQIPITYDSLHYRCNPSEHLTPLEAFNICYNTWGNYKPLFHFSDSDSNNNHHANYPTELHYEFLNKNIDLDFEFKHKDFAIEKFFNQ